MKVRFPLYGKILAWFFLNLGLLGIVFYGFVKVQFRYGLDSLLMGSARDRIQSVSRIIASDLERTPQAQWSDVLDRFNQAYGVKFYLFRDPRMQVAGDKIELPREVAVRMAEVPRGIGGGGGGGGRGRMGLGPPSMRGGGSGPPFPRGPHDPEPRALLPQIPVRPENLPPQLDPLPPNGPRPEFRAPLLAPLFFLKTSNPSRYWAAVVVSHGRYGPGARPLVLLTMSETLGGGGLFFDYVPWIAVGLGVIAVSALLWFPLVRGLTRSISQMTRATEQISTGQFDTRVDSLRRDELGRLGQAINVMAARLSGYVTGQKRFMGDIAHELCSPLARVQLALGILEQRADESQRAQLEDLREEVQYMANLVNELLSFSKASLQPKSIQLKPVSLRDTVDTAMQREGAENVEFVVEVPAELKVQADPELLLRAIANLIRNSKRYAADHGPITLCAKQAGEFVGLTISDCGPGVPDEALSQLFEPFYRPEESRDRQTGGVGLGLAIVKTCIEACQGTVSCENLKPRGFAVTIRLKTL